MGYKHGPYGEIGDSKVTTAKQSDVVVAYIGTAPINLIRGYADADLIHMPIKVANMSDVQSKLGYPKTGRTSLFAKPSPSTSTTPSVTWARSTS